MINWKKTTYALLLTFLLVGCGFHLQGSKASLPPSFQDVYINSRAAPHSALAPELTVALKDNGVNCVATPESAKIVLNILNDTQASHQVGSGASQETRKYQLTNKVNFSLTDEKGRKLYGPVTVESMMMHYVYSGQVLGNNQEEKTLYQSLRRSLIQQMLFKLSSKEVKAALSNPPSS